MRHLLSQLDNYYKELDNKQTTCKHQNKQTLHNVGDFKIRVKCIDCNKILKFEFNNK